MHLKIRLALSAMAVMLLPTLVNAQAHDASMANHEPHYFDAAEFGIDPTSVTFSKDIAPILQRSCQNCHRLGGGGPMSLQTYEEVRPWAPVIMYRTAIRDRMGAMPPFFVEKELGIHRFKEDPSLSDVELAVIQAWANNGAPQGNSADLPPPRDWALEGEWALGQPELILRSPDVTLPAIGPDWWGNLGLVPTGLTEDRYVKSVEVREVNDIPVELGSSTVGGRYVFHHMTYTSGQLSENADEIVGTSVSWPIHEVGRNPDIFPDKAGRLLPANSALRLGAAHLHSNGRETTGHLEFGFTFFPQTMYLITIAEDHAPEMVWIWILCLIRPIRKSITM